MAEPVGDHVTEPSEQEKNLGCIAGGLWGACSLGGGASLAWLDEPARTVVGILVGIPWLVLGVWWLVLFLRRTGRSYRAGASGRP